ncbi:hypothetical protein AK830_g4376 [Neonectria ditissima]|uniref:SnoaL-like domain-containing protein n=1 Tax=Neonectria ditissima TaxID=78410 RepID=A0A0P7BN62_9HYPO|nr:hypothetical protein AK830_g4376 [Neonectria ditissima]
MQVFTTLDPSVFPSILSDDYKHEFAPASLNPPQPFDREGFTAHVKRLQGVLRSFPVRMKETWPNPSLNQVVIWADSETNFHDHVEDSDDAEEWKLHGEYMWVLTMDESGEKITHVLEFLDSKVTEKIRGLMARAFKKKQELEGSRTEKVEGAWEIN